MYFIAELAHSVQKGVSDSLVAASNSLSLVSEAEVATMQLYALCTSGTSVAHSFPAVHLCRAFVDLRTISDDEQHTQQAVAHHNSQAWHGCGVFSVAPGSLCSSAGLRATAESLGSGSSSDDGLHVCRSSFKSFLVLSDIVTQPRSLRNLYGPNGTPRHHLIMLPYLLISVGGGTFSQSKALIIIVDAIQHSFTPTVTLPQQTITTCLVPPSQRNCMRFVASAALDEDFQALAEFIFF